MLAHVVHIADVLAHRLELSSSGPSGVPVLASGSYKAIGISSDGVARIEDELKEMNISLR